MPKELVYYFWISKEIHLIEYNEYSNLICDVKPKIDPFINEKKKKKKFINYIFLRKINRGTYDQLNFYCSMQCLTDLKTFNLVNIQATYVLDGFTPTHQLLEKKKKK